MPWGLKRYQPTGQSHFVTFCCYHRRPQFTADASRRVFENALERVRRTFRLRVYRHVVMPENVHLLHHATGCEGAVEIESEWAARQRERAAGRLCQRLN